MKWDWSSLVPTHTDAQKRLHSECCTTIRKAHCSIIKCTLPKPIFKKGVKGITHCHNCLKMIWNKAKINLPAKRPVIIPHAINNGMAPPWWREPVWCLGEVVLEMGECLFRIGDVYVVDGLLLSHRRSTAAMSMSISAYPRRAFPPFVSAIIGSLYTTVTQNLNYFRLDQNVTSTLVQVFCIFYQASQWNFLNFQKKKAARNHHASSWGWFRKQQQRGRGNGKRERGKQCTFSNFFFFLFNTFFLDVNGKK